MTLFIIYIFASVIHRLSFANVLVAAEATLNERGILKRAAESRE